MFASNLLLGEPDNRDVIPLEETSQHLHEGKYG